MRTKTKLEQTALAALHGPGTVVWIFVFFLALFLRVGVQAFEPHAIANDEVAYVNLATEWAETGRFARAGVPETHIAPLFPALHAVLIARGLDPVGAGTALALLISALVPMATGRLFEVLTGRVGAVTAGLVLCLHPPLLASSAAIQPEGLMALLWAYFLSACLGNRPVIAGIALGLLCLTRPEAIVLLPLWLIFEMTRRRSIVWVASAASASLLFAAPYIAHQSWTEGRFCLSGKDIWVYANGIAQVQTGNRPVEWELLDEIRAEIDSVASHIARDPMRFIRGYVVRTWYEMRNLLRQTYVIGLLAAVIGWLGLRRRRPEIASYFLIPLGVLALIPIGMTAYRHTLTVIPLIVGLAVLAALQPEASNLFRRINPFRAIRRDGDKASHD